MTADARKWATARRAAICPNWQLLSVPIRQNRREISENRPKGAKRLTGVDRSCHFDGNQNIGIGGFPRGKPSTRLFFVGEESARGFVAVWDKTDQKAATA
jgi:hypothetical protein